MNTKLNLNRRKLLVWSAPVIATVTLPAHAQTSAGLSVQKNQTGGPNPAMAEGDVIDYTVIVDNTGSVPLTGVVVVDTLPDGSLMSLSPPTESLNNDGILEVGELWTFTISYTVTASDLTSGAALTNMVSVTADQAPSAVTDSAVTPVTAVCTCEGPPILTVLAPPKCAGDPPIGSADIEILAPGECPMELINIVVTTSDPASTLGSLPAFPAAVTVTNGVSITWTGPASDAITCLPLATITADIEYACANGISLFETYDITALLIASVP